MPVERLRGRAGQRQRQRRLDRTNGLCERCLGIGRWTGTAGGRVEIATRVNHIVPLTFGGLDVDENTENLCRPCDIDVTAEQFRFDTARGERGVDRTGRPTGADHAWNGEGASTRPRAARRSPTPPGGQSLGGPGPDTA